jgi:hypothetical protein
MSTMIVETACAPTALAEATGGATTGSSIPD